MRLLASVLLVLVIAPLTAHAQKIKVRVERDTSFAFSGVRSWNWHPDGAGDVKMLSMSTDDPVPIKAIVEPMVVSSVEAALGARGLVRRPDGPADVLVTYYVLVTPATSSTQLGYYLPPVTDYGIPVMLGGATPTTQLRAFEKGTLVLDVIAPTLKSVVWRGIAETEIHREFTPEQRRARIDRAVREIVKKLPKK